MKDYDFIVVLGSKPDRATWHLPAHVIASLDKAADLLQAGVAPVIAVSGGHALSFDKKGITEPLPEAEMMARYLIDRRVSADRIVKEAQSKDTISNLYFLKHTIFMQQQAVKLLFIIADFRLERLRYLAQKVLGPSYHVAFQTVLSDVTERYPQETATYERTKYYLNAMRPGDDQFVAHMFYGHPFYTTPWPLTPQSLTKHSRRGL